MEDNRPSTASQPQTRVDYKEILSPEDFLVFSRLRELRKKVAEAQGIPVYAVFTNDQLAEMARKRPQTDADLKKLDGIGEGKCGKFGEPFIKALSGMVGETGGMAF